MINIQPICTTDFTDPPMVLGPCCWSVDDIRAFINFSRDPQAVIGAWMKLRIFLQLNPQNIFAN